jgi:glycosyltransferase involved in cell wall biosynthesis
VGFLEKIVIVTKRDIKHHGGGGDIYAHEIARRLVDEFDFTIVASNVANASKEEVIDGVKIARLSTSVSRMRLMVPLYLVKNKFDFVVDNVTVIPWFTPLYCNTPKTAIIHQLVQELFYNELPQYQAKIAYRIEPELFRPYRNTPIVCPGGKGTIETLVGIGIPKRNVFSIPGGCPPEFISICKNAWDRKASFPLVVCLARLEPYKRIDFAIQAFAKVKKNVPDAQLVIIGWGSHEQALRSLVNSLNLQDSVKFTGRVDCKEKMKLLMQAYVHIWSLGTRDGGGLSIIEAGACGTASLAWDVAGPQDTIITGKTGFLLPYGDVAGLANRMEELLVNEKLRRRLSSEAQKWASQNTWDQAAEKFREHIKLELT